jgi:hypothetical protein
VVTEHHPVTCLRWRREGDRYQPWVVESVPYLPWLARRQTDLSKDHMCCPRVSRLTLDQCVACVSRRLEIRGALGATARGQGDYRDAIGTRLGRGRRRRGLVQAIEEADQQKHPKATMRNSMTVLRNSP